MSAGVIQVVLSWEWQPTIRQCQYVIRSNSVLDGIPMGRSRADAIEEIRRWNFEREEKGLPLVFVMSPGKMRNEGIVRLDIERQEAHGGEE